MKPTHQCRSHDSGITKSALRTGIFNRSLLLAASAVLGLMAGCFATQAANIVWVSDYNDPAGAANDAFSAFTPAGGNTITDFGFIRMLEAAGHTVIRYNSPGAAASLMSQADVDALNTNDLIILGRAGNSGAFQTPKGTQWNTAITKPVICMSPYFVRPDGGRLGWFTGGTLPDTTPTVVTAGDPTALGTDYLFGGVVMNGSKTAFNFDEMIDRNTSVIQNDPVVGAIIHATATFPAEGNGAATTAYICVGFPAGTAVAAGANILAGYRMWLAGGSREAGTGYPTTVNGSAGRENLTPTGEEIFLRAVQLAINNGVPPATDPSAPPSIVSLSTDATVLEGRQAGFAVTVAGAAPRTIQWQRDIGDGVTFSDIPDAGTPFSISRLSLPAVTSADNNAKFRVVVTNPNGTVTSDVITLTVIEDTVAPTPLSAASLDGNTITVIFDELLDNDPLDGDTAIDQFSYTVSDANGAQPLNIVVRPDGRSVTLNLDKPVASTFSINIANVEDRFLNAMNAAGVEISGINFGFTGGEVGATQPAGGGDALDSNTFEVSGGGFDFQPITEQMRLAYRSVSGDFDARVRVRSLVGTNRLESAAKAILNARASDVADAPSISAFVTPPYPGNNSFGSVARDTTGGPTLSNAVASANFVNGIPAAIPNTWLRIVRAGNSFKTYGSADGSTWNQLNAATIAMGDPVLVGAGVNSHRNGQVATATFSDFTVTQGTSSPTLVNSSYSAGTFSASFQTQNGIAYRVQYKDDFNLPGWMDLTTINGDGSVKSFVDTAGGNRFYRVITP